MVKKILIGVIGFQGDVFEHVSFIKKTLDHLKIPGEVNVVKNKEGIKNIDALILPGGESTTISRLIFKSKLNNAIYKLIKEDIPIMGTCAGCVILAKELSNNSDDVKLLKAMNMRVKRNAFGRQRESFEKNIEIEGFDEPYNAVFIRAPIIEEVWGSCKPLAKIGNKIVMARENNLLALSFHPELTDDFRIHEYFLKMVLSNK